MRCERSAEGAAQQWAQVSLWHQPGDTKATAPTFKPSFIFASFSPPPFSPFFFISVKEISPQTASPQASLQSQNKQQECCKAVCWKGPSG